MTTKQFDNFADIITFTRASTGTYLDSDGLLKTATTNTPRIEYDINGNRKGLLIEEARTNLLLRSEVFTIVPWSLNGDSRALSGSSFLGVDTHIITESGASFLGVFQSVTLSAGPTTFWAIVKAGTSSEFRLRYANSTNKNADFNLSNGTVTSVTAGSTAGTVDYGDGYWLCWHTATPVAEVTAMGLYTQNGSVEVVISQLEAGSFPTSYIPTAGSTATRAADVASIPTSAFGYNQKAGTLYVDGTFRNGETIVTLGSQTIAADANGDKDYAVSYSSSPSATSLVLNRGTYKTLNYYPRVLTAAQIAELLA
jgi:hypothetical protein